MNFPNSWSRLPGPADLLAVIGEDLGGGSVLLGLPEDIPGSMFAVEVAELILRSGFSQWETVRTDESGMIEPRAYVGQRFNESTAEKFVLWVDATGQISAAQAWIDYARRFAGVVGIPRMCIAMDMDYAVDCQEEKGLRRRVWSDFVTPSDSRALVEHTCRRSGNSQMHIALKSALVAELTGGDLSFAERLSGQRLGGILNSPTHPPERVWAAQVAVLFPIIERERQRLLNIHRGLWRLPYIREDGKRIERLEDLEIGDMANQVRRIPALAAERERLDWLRRVRNALAHAKVVPWSTLTSHIAIQIVDFRR